jgi:hypothetical protein
MIYTATNLVAHCLFTKTDISETTKLALSSHIDRQNISRLGVMSGGNILGTIAHQYSPRINFQVRYVF